MNINIDELHFAAVERFQVRFELFGRSLVDLDDAEDGRFANDTFCVVGGPQEGRHHFWKNGDSVGLWTLLHQPR